MRKCWVLLLAFALLLPGCGAAAETEPTADYPWMAGESPIPVSRIGVNRMGLNQEPHAINSKGVFFLRQAESGGADTYLYYADHQGDTLSKLCSLEGCAHNDPSCNAWLSHGQMLHYHQGYLYAVTGGESASEQTGLIRMRSDGSDRQELLDLTSFAKEKGAEGAAITVMLGGYCVLRLTSQEEEATQTYIYPLGKSLRKIYPWTEPIEPSYQCGQMIIGLSDGPEGEECWSLNLADGTAEYLTRRPEHPLWFTEQEVYYLQSGNVLKRTYETNKVQVLGMTLLEGKYDCLLCSDCLIFASNEWESNEKTDRQLYIFDWEFNVAETVQLTESFQRGPRWSLVTETYNRLILTDADPTQPALYYIEKSQLGTGYAQVRAYTLPE